MAVKVFVSYSHADAAYLEKGSLIDYLKSSLKEENIKFWSDESLVAGDLWDEKIRVKINDSQIALALVSQAFLNSDYCSKVEIRRFLERARTAGLIIFPVILSPCEWDKYKWLKERQFLPGGDKTIEEHYTEPGPRKRLFLDILKALRTQAKEHFNGEYNLAMGALSASVNMFNDIEPKMRSVITNKPPVIKDHSLLFEGKDTQLVSTLNGKTYKIIEHKDLKKTLAGVEIKHLMRYHKHLTVQYHKWEDLDDRSLDPKTGLPKKNIVAQQKELIREMKKNLNGIIKYLNDIGFELHDHYTEIHDLINNFK
jgi:TIR domain